MVDYGRKVAILVFMVFVGLKRIIEESVWFCL